MTPIEDGGKEFARLRKELKWTQQEAADQLDRSLGWIRRIEQGQIPCPAYAIYALRHLANQKKRGKR